MLEGYSKNWLKYQTLWDKYGVKREQSEASLPFPKITTQEESIKWSLLLQKALSSLAKEHGIRRSELTKSFIEGSCLSLGETKLKGGFVSVCKLISISKGKYNGVSASFNDKESILSLDIVASTQDFTDAKQLIDKFGLFFDFDSVDDLFLEEDRQRKSVIE